MIKPLRLLIPCAALCLAAILFWHWRPERQIKLHQRDLLRRAEARNWTRLEPMVSPRYRDQWGMDRERALREAREILRQFFALEIQSVAPPTFEVSGIMARVTVNLRVEGTGAGLAETVKSAANATRSPWVFRWERASSKPWDWQLTGVENRGLRLDPAWIDSLP